MAKVAGSRSSSRTSKPSRSTTPSRATRRSPSDIAAASQTVSVPAIIGPRPDTRPPAPLRATGCPSSPTSNDTGPRLETIRNGRSSAAGMAVTLLRSRAPPTGWIGAALRVDDPAEERERGSGPGRLVADERVDGEADERCRDHGCQPGTGPSGDAEGHERG